jgi:hypothetical protein
MGCEEAVVLSVYNNDDGGNIYTDGMFRFDDEVLSAMFGADDIGSMELTRENLHSHPATGRIQCLKRCNLWKV